MPKVPIPTLRGLQREETSVLLTLPTDLAWVDGPAHGSFVGFATSSGAVVTVLTFLEVHLHDADVARHGQ